MIVAGTGHRPEKLGGHSDEAFVKLVEFASDKLATLKNAKSLTVISGMALGWDLALAVAALNAEVPLVAALPFADQSKMWPRASQQLHQAILDKATRVEIVSPGDYEPYKMQRRNRWMVDECTHVLALWNGTVGGTRNCILYAEERQRPLINLWPLWEAR